MPTGRSNLAVAASRTKLYAVGGYNGVGGIDDKNELEIYESATDSWSTATSMPTARTDFAAAIVGHTLFALGGGDSMGLLDVAEAYDTEGGSWSAAEWPSAEWPSARYSFAAVAGP